MPVVLQLHERVKGFASAAFSSDSLKARFFRGSAWLAAGSLTEQSFRFGRNMILARLLAPEAFGTMAIISSASSVIHTLTDIGVKEAIIQNPRGTEGHYASAAWWLALGRAVSICAVIVLVAPWVGRFYGSPELGPLLRVSAIGVIFDGALSSRAYVAMKEMKFGKWAAINHGGGICGVIITVVLSFFLRDVWALVLGFVFESGCRCLFSFILCPYVPSLSWDREALRDLLRFSRGLFGLSFLNLIFARTDVFVLAKLYPASNLGLYIMAIYLVQTPTNFLTNLLGQTLLPTYSQIQENKDRINRILSQVTTVLILAGAPLLVFVYFCGHSLLTLVYGARYGAGAAALTLASAVALINIVNAQITLVFYSKGLPQLHRSCVLIMAVLMIALIYPLSKTFGLAGGQLACLISVVVGYLFQVVRLRRLTEIDTPRYLKGFVTGSAVSLTVFAVCLGAQYFPALAQPLPNVIIGLLGCALAYSLIGTIMFFNRESLTA